jgi:hypothetical protein
MLAVLLQEEAPSQGLNQANTTSKIESLCRTYTPNRRTAGSTLLSSTNSFSAVQTFDIARHLQAKQHQTLPTIPSKAQ